MKGTVYKSTGSWYTVKAEDGRWFECRIKGKFRIKGIKSTNPVAVGDVVDFDLDTKSDVEIIIADFSAKKESNLLILSGVPIKEKVTQYGPYVMNTQTEIMEAMRDYQQGKMGILIEEFE